ncbi:hypothetical protein BGZ63DRAFT_396218 [Mariannaea sp. PMI_226]|nr:hypothetical protein BGZ63DRAFT_396218 [Mariannaea sp. PMI_226]
MQSFTSIERSNPPSRRKSCLACTKSRRRCDQARPTCQRCSQRNIDCRYPYSARPAPRPIPVLPENTEHIERESEPLLPFDPAETLQTPCLDMLDSILVPTDDIASHVFQESLEWESLLDSGQQLSRSNQRLLTTSQDALDRCRRVTVPQVSKMIASRLQYAIDKISASPSQMVLENQMPWCHAHLYDDGMPRCMQYAVSSAALYRAKNDVNARVIRDNIESRVQDLLSSPAVATPLETLAYAQALFMYQVLRLLDTNARIRFTYEATMPHLEEAAYALIPYIDFDEPQSIDEPDPALEPLLLYPASKAYGFWASWVFQESARRTLAIITFFILTYRYMKGEAGNQCSENKAAGRSVTMSAQLWNAKDPVDFTLAWRNKRHFVLHSDMLDNLPTVMDDAEEDDIDDFAKITLTSVMGLDEAKGWLAMRGIAL